MQAFEDAGAVASDPRGSIQHLETRAVGTRLDLGDQFAATRVAPSSSALYR
jgi:hypothetical protein